MYRLTKRSSDCSGQFSRLGPSTFLLDEPYLLMSTAIVRIYTLQGFVIAADTRACASTGEVRCDSVQKLFSVEQANRRLAYAIAGDVEIIQPDTGEVLLNFATETGKAMEEFSNEQKESLRDLAEQVCHRILGEVRKAKAIRRPSKLPEKSKTHIFIDGYNNSEAGRSHIVFTHRGEHQRQTGREVADDSLNDNCGYGSTKVLKALDEGDERFASFMPAKVNQSLSIGDAILVAGNRVRAQFGDFAPALEMDPKVCKYIGGRVLIATVTAESGFQWVEGFHVA
jgi:hypothetical protein